MRLVVGDAAWADTIPEWLKAEVAAERLVLGLAGVLKPELEGRVGYAEVCVYLYTASLRAPMPSEYAQVYLHVSSTLMKRRGMQVPEECVVTEEQLRPDENRVLEELRRDLWRLRGGAVKHPVIDAVRALKAECEVLERGGGVQQRMFDGEAA
jgi:hypothetical protein